MPSAGRCGKADTEHAAEDVHYTRIRIENMLFPHPPQCHTFLRNNSGLHLLCQGFRTTAAVQSGGDDASGIAGAFPARIQPFQSGMFQRTFITGDAALENWYVFHSLSAGPILRQIRAIYDQTSPSLPSCARRFPPEQSHEGDEVQCPGGSWLEEGGGHAPFRKSGTFWAGAFCMPSGAAGGRLQGFLVGHARQHAVLCGRTPYLPDARSRQIRSWQRESPAGPGTCR